MVPSQSREMLVFTCDIRRAEKHKQPLTHSNTDLISSCDFESKILKWQLILLF